MRRIRAILLRVLSSRTRSDYTLCGVDIADEWVTGEFGGKVVEDTDIRGNLLSRKGEGKGEAKGET